MILYQQGGDSLSVGERLQKARKALHVTQVEFGESLGITQSAISAVESGKVKLTDRLAQSIQSNYNINVEWLRTGEGEMLVEPSEDEQLAQFVGEVLAGRPDDLRRAFLVAMAQLDENGWNSLASFVRTVYEEGRLDKEKESPIICQ